VNEAATILALAWIALVLAIVAAGLIDRALAAAFGFLVNRRPAAGERPVLPELPPGYAQHFRAAVREEQSGAIERQVGS
jgi:hypothetical protein